MLRGSGLGASRQGRYTQYARIARCPAELGPLQWDGVRCRGVTGVVSVGSTSRGSCPSSITLTEPSRDPSVRPRVRKSSAPSCWDCEHPRQHGSNRAVPKKRRARNEPRHGQLCGHPVRTGSPSGAHERAEGSGEGEESQPRKHVKSLRVGRWKITLAPSRPVLYAARRAIFLRS